MMEEMICTPLDLAICSGEIMVNQVVFTYSMTDMTTPMSRTTAETESRTPRRRLIQPRVVILMTFSRRRLSRTTQRQTT